MALPYTGRKSVVAYVGTAIRAFVSLLIWAAIALIGVPALVRAANLPALVQTIVTLIFVATFLITAARTIYTLFYLTTIKWVVTPEGLRVTEGILPWRKSDISAPYETIFEATCSNGFFQKMFNYGTLQIRRTEGVTSRWAVSQLHAAVGIQSLINSKVQEYRTSMRPVPIAVTASRSAVDELAELARLKASGAITADDYERMKSRIVGLPSAAAEAEA